MTLNHCPHLLSPITLGDLTLNNRIIMAPLTRCRALVERTPNALMAEYYRQRATAGLILSEATSVNAMGVGYPNTPGIWSPAQIEGWRAVTSAVHQAGGKIMLQLWHVGRISDPVYLNGAQPVAPSAIAATGHVNLLRPHKNFDIPRALETQEITAIVEDYRQGAANAKDAGFDGVEIHGANGYLLDQFLQSNTNLRTDVYGGSLENRARLLMQVVEAAMAVWGPGRVGVHLSPRCDFHDMANPHQEDTFLYVARELSKKGIAFICTREYLAEDSLSQKIKMAFGGPLIANERFDFATAEAAIADNKADAVAFGKWFISNPDLVARCQQAASLNEWDANTFYGPDAKGYTDYPALYK
jgi:2,4-dienoyl-CoA reductase-like NADH-dependent reductase (Old Yellow Enzyme family)